ncbi:MAG: dihydroneopterin aldolase [Gammaproteobacteria bacterium]
MDTVFIRDLRVKTIIGIYPWERRIRQSVRINLEMGMDNRRPAASDAIEDAVNYKAVAKRVQTFTEENEFQLVETLAERLADLLLKEFTLPWLRLTVSKPGAVRDAAEVGVVIERQS